MTFRVYTHLQLLPIEETLPQRTSKLPINFHEPFSIFRYLLLGVYNGSIVQDGEVGIMRSSMNAVSPAGMI